jgi:hypothetical protein
MQQTAYEQSLVTEPTTNYRIIRQPRILIGEPILTLPNNYAVNFAAIPASGSTLAGTNVPPSNTGFYDIVFSPSGQVVGINPGQALLWMSVWDTTMDTPDPNRVGIVGVRRNTGSIGAYSVAPFGDPFAFVRTDRQSGM